LWLKEQLAKHAPGVHPDVPLATGAE
jgi:hypothetical protein